MIRISIRMAISPSFGGGWGEASYLLLLTSYITPPLSEGFRPPINGGTEGGVKTIDWGEASYFFFTGSQVRSQPSFLNIFLSTSPSMMVVCTWQPRI